MSENEQPDEPKAKKRPIGIIILVVVVVIGAFFGIRMYLYNSGHVTTDDAYVTNDVVPVSPRVNANIVNVLVKENQVVKPGELLVQLDDTTFRADVAQAKANLALAEAGARAASVDVGLTAQTGQAQVEQAQGGVTAGSSDIGAAQSNVSKAQSEVATAKATLIWAQSQATAADASVRSRSAARQGLIKQVAGAKAMVSTAESGVKVALANLANAKATASNADRDAKRYRGLADQGAVPVSQAEARETAAATAQANVQAALQQVEVARSTVIQRQADYEAAEQQVREAETAIAEARAQAASTRATITADAARINEASTGVVAAQHGVQAAMAHAAQATGKLRESDTVAKKVSISEANKQTALAKVQQAKAALQSAEVALARTRITAPIGGRISRKTAEIGQQVATGQPLMSIIPAEQPWIVANFKETQMRSIRPGQEVEIEIDAIPGHTFSGKVESVSAGTGSTFALLPADNATGNFTKVVQRVPVKIIFVAGQADLEKLNAWALRWRRHRGQMKYKDLDKNPGYQLWLTTNAWQRIVRKALEPLELTHVQFVMLASVDILGQENECVTQAQVSRFAATDENMTSQVIRSLAKRGLVVRQDHPTDARARRLQLTDAGLNLIDEAKAAVKPAREKFFAPLGARGEELAKLLGSLVDGADIG